MQTLTQQLTKLGLNDRILTASQLRHLVAGTDQRRHHLVNRAVKAGELMRLRRGLYVLADEFRQERFGLFAFHPLATKPGYFLELVRRAEADGQSFLVARPLRALLDLVCLKKIEWQGFAWIEEGMRVDRDALNKVTGAEVRTLKDVYKHRRVQEFIGELEQALGLGGCR